MAATEAAVEGLGEACADTLAAQLAAALEERLGKILEEHQRVLLAAISEPVGRATIHSRKPSLSGRVSGFSGEQRPSGRGVSDFSGGSDGTVSTSERRASTEQSSGAMRHTMSVQQKRMQDIKKTIMRGNFRQPMATGAQASDSKNYARRAKESQWFELGVAVCIAANTVSIGYNADWCIKHPGKARPMVFTVLDYSFLGVFALELLVRMLAERLDFFKPGRKGFSWNMFDMLVVVATSLNEMNPLKMNLSVVRALRPLRLVHAVRMIRILKAFRELRSMVTGILNCGHTLLWSIVLLSLVSYIYAVFLLQICADWLGSLDESVVLGDPKIQAAIEKFDKHLSSLPWCVYNLFKAMTNGHSWGDELGDPMFELGPAMVFSFVLYITITVLCVLNVITAAFVEAAARTRQDDDTNTLDHIHLRTEWMDKIRDLFDKHDLDGDGLLNWQEFKSVAMDWRTQAYFREHDLDFDFQNARQLFHLFDWDRSGHINIDEFAQGVHHLRGTARSLDMFRQFQQLGQRVEVAMQRLEKGESESRVSARNRSRYLASPRGSSARDPAPFAATSDLSI